MSFVDKMQLEPGSTVLLHNKVRCLGAGAAGLCRCCCAVLVLLCCAGAAGLCCCCWLPVLLLRCA